LVGRATAVAADKKKGALAELIKSVNLS